MATLEIKARDVDITLGRAQHMYWLYTNDAGDQYAFSGFPGDNGTGDAFFEDISVEYDVKYKDSDDYDPTVKENYNGTEPPHRAMTVFAGSDADLEPILNAMRTEAERINAEGYDYNLALIAAFYPDSNIGEGLIDNDQNSNTVAMALAEAAGFEKLAKWFVETNDLNVPGADANLEHSWIEQGDEIADALIDSYNQTVSDAVDLYNQATDKAAEAYSQAVQEAVALYGEASDLYHNAVAEAAQLRDEAIAAATEVHGAITTALAGFAHRIDKKVQAVLDNADAAEQNLGLVMLAGGDTLSEIAEQYGITLEELLEQNLQFKDNPDLIFPGQMIILKDIEGAQSLKEWLDENPDLSIDDPIIDQIKQYLASAAVQSSPLILDLDGDGVVETTAKGHSDIHFDHDNNGFAEQTGWVGEDDGLLVFDRNNNQRIDNGSELFGNHTLLADGSKASNGFEALQSLDSNADGQIDQQDSAFAQLKIWQDINQNGETTIVWRSAC